MTNVIHEIFFNSISDKTQAENYINNDRGLPFAKYRPLFKVILNKIEFDSILIELKKKYSLEHIKASGIYSFYNFASKDIPFLVVAFIEKSQIAYLWARRIDSSEFPKTLNLKNLKPPIFNIDVIEKAKPNQKIFLCEGVFDTLVLDNLEYKAIGLLGVHSYSIETLNLLLPFEVVIAFDNDEAGNISAQKIADWFWKYNKSVSRIKLPFGMDINEFYKSGELKMNLICENILPTKGGSNLNGNTNFKLPEPFKEENHEIDPFPLDILPDSIREYVIQEAKFLSIQPDIIAVQILAVLGSLIGTKIVLKPKKNDRWIVPPNLNSVCISPSGTKKTPCLAKAILPLDSLDKILLDKFEKEMEIYNSEIKTYQIKFKKAKSDLEKKSLIEPKLPKRIWVKIYDATPEKIGDMLSHSKNGILQIFDELASALEKFEKPGNEGLRGFYLEGCNGLGKYTVHRITRGDLEIPNFMITIIGNSQNIVFNKHVKEAMSSSKGADGLLQRFPLMISPNENKEYEYYDEAVDQDLFNQVADLYKALYFLEPKEIGAISNKDIKSPYLEFTSEAYDLFKVWLTELENSLINSPFHPAIVSHFGKYRGYVPAISLILHLADRKTGPVEIASFKKAIVLSEYLKKHAIRIYNFSLNQDKDIARLILKKIIEKKLNNEFTVRDIERKNWSGVNDKENLKKSLELLVSKNYLSAKFQKNENGGPSKFVYLVNPLVFECDIK